MLAQIRSHLFDRLQRVNIIGILSNTQELSFGVPQGSVLGTILYCLYIKHVSDIIKHLGLLHHPYADDTQLNITIKNNDYGWIVSCSDSVERFAQYFVYRVLFRSCQFNICVFFAF